MERQSKTFAIVGILIIIFLVLVLVFRRPIPIEQPVNEPAEQTEIEEQEKPMTDIPVEEEEDKKAVILALQIANQSLIEENVELRDDIDNLWASFVLLRNELDLPAYNWTAISVTDDDIITGRDDKHQILGLELRQKELLEEKEKLQDGKDFLLESIETMKLELEI